MTYSFNNIKGTLFLKSTELQWPPERTEKMKTKECHTKYTQKDLYELARYASNLLDCRLDIAPLKCSEALYLIEICDTQLMKDLSCDEAFIYIKAIADFVQLQRANLLVVTLRDN